MITAMTTIWQQALNSHFTFKIGLKHIKSANLAKPLFLTFNCHTMTSRNCQITKMSRINSEPIGILGITYITSLKGSIIFSKNYQVLILCGLFLTVKRDTLPMVTNVWCATQLSDVMYNNTNYTNCSILCRIHL